MLILEGFILSWQRDLNPRPADYKSYLKFENCKNNSVFVVFSFQSYPRLPEFPENCPHFFKHKFYLEFLSKLLHHKKQGTTMKYYALPKVVSIHAENENSSVQILPKERFTKINLPVEIRVIHKCKISAFIYI